MARTKAGEWVILEPKLWELYRQGLTDKEIAEKAGCKLHQVNQWRRRQYLPPNKKLCKISNQYALTGGVSYETALEPDECARMEMFLRRLSRTHRIAKEMGKRLDITVFINIYRGGHHGEIQLRSVREAGM